MPAPTLDGRLLCASECTYAITADGVLDLDAADTYYAGAGFTKPPSTFVGGDSLIDACLVGSIPDGVVLAFRRWPPAYGAFAAAVLAAGLSSRNLDSLERYALSAFPFVIVAAGLLSREWLERLVLVLSGSAMVGYAVLVFLGAAVP